MGYRLTSWRQSCCACACVVCVRACVLHYVCHVLSVLRGVCAPCIVHMLRMLQSITVGQLGVVMRCCCTRCCCCWCCFGPPAVLKQRFLLISCRRCDMRYAVIIYFGLRRHGMTRLVRHQHDATSSCHIAISFRSGSVKSCQIVTRSLR